MVNRGTSHQSPIKSDPVFKRLYLTVIESAIDIVLVRAELAGNRLNEAQLSTHFDHALRLAMDLNSIDQIRSRSLVAKTLFFGAKTVYDVGNTDAAVQALKTAARISESIPEDERIVQPDEIEKWIRRVQERKPPERDGSPDLCRCQSSSLRGPISSSLEVSTPVDTPVHLPPEYLRHGTRSRVGSNASSLRNVVPISMEWGDATPITPAASGGPPPKMEPNHHKESLERQTSWRQSGLRQLESLSRRTGRPMIDRQGSTASTMPSYTREGTTSVK